MAGGSDDSSSSSDDEVMKRCKEAVWETRSDSKKGERLTVVSVVRHEANVSVRMKWKCPEPS